jgi:hypothetical protein
MTVSKLILITLGILFHLQSCTKEESYLAVPSPNKTNTLYFYSYLEANTLHSYTIISLNLAKDEKTSSLRYKKNHLKVRNKGRDSWQLLLKWIDEEPIIYTPKAKFLQIGNPSITHIETDTFLKMYHRPDLLDNLVKINQEDVIH